MATVTSLGLYRPTGLQHAIREGILPPDPPATSYTWTIWSTAGGGDGGDVDGDVDDDGSIYDDELLVTRSCVVWSRGGLFRQSFNFELEKEPVAQALFTTFPHANAVVKDAAVTKPTAKTSSAAIVVLLKTQAHIYFLAGATHVVHLPFEVEHAVAAPVGVILQRKLRTDSLLTTSLHFPRAPPSSFVSSHPQAWSASASQGSTFSIADLNAPKPMPIPLLSAFKDTWDQTNRQHDGDWPRLFSLSEPLAELGLIVAAPGRNEHRSRRRSSSPFATLDASEEVIYISQKDDLEEFGDTEPLVLVVTTNQLTNTYTVWKLSYIPQDGRHASGRPAGTSTTRRRSSFIPATGASTPAVNARSSLRESLGGANTAGSHARHKYRDKDDHEDITLDLTTSLDPDFDGGTIPRRKSRRVSSMLARGDLSATHERSAYSDLATNFVSTGGKRGESFGGQSTRKSSGPYAGGGMSQNQPLNRSLGSFLEAPVDDLLDELRAGGDFEGFHSMGLEDEDFSALRQEIALTKLVTTQAEHDNVRFSNRLPCASSEHTVVVLESPRSSVGSFAPRTLVVCILNTADQRLLSMVFEFIPEKALKRDTKQKLSMSATHTSTKTASGVVDICKVRDGKISRLLVLNDSMPNVSSNREQSLNLQAPWSYTMPLELPSEFKVHNTRHLSYSSHSHAVTEPGHKRVISYSPLSMSGIRDAKPGGLVTLVDDGGDMHQISIIMQPRSKKVGRILQICEAILPGVQGGEGLLVAWWHALHWLHLQDSSMQCDAEWRAIVIILLSLFLLSADPKLDTRFSSPALAKQRRAKGFYRSSSGAQNALGAWEEMLAQQTANGCHMPAWMDGSAWKWVRDDPAVDLLGEPIQSAASHGIREQIRLTRMFLDSPQGRPTLSKMRPWKQDATSAVSPIVQITYALHLLREEEKLNINTAGSLHRGGHDLLPVLRQMTAWLGWRTWCEVYSVEDSNLGDGDFDDYSLHLPDIPDAPEMPSVLAWLSQCLSTQTSHVYRTITDLREQSDAADNGIGQTNDAGLLPRTHALKRFFHLMEKNWTPVQTVEAMVAAGVTPRMLETFPEGVLAPFQEAIAQCQADPPTTWPGELLSMIDRADVKTLLHSTSRARAVQMSLATPTHEASSDVHAICLAMNDAEVGSCLDTSSESDRLIISRAIFKDDRRTSEAASILSTFKPTVAYCKPEAHWSDSDLLEQQKEHAQMLAYRTLAIPSGRGLLYYGARTPFLTQKYGVGGFNLSCVMKPDNNTIGVDKTAFTEEKVCWAFFHSGVAMGLSISRDARGIDTSWILYNKPALDLSNRHAGFLLALGLNGHLKSVAKWVAFKYLTPKHTMTSIGLLLGLAASYIGTMDSLVTRLLSVHVTRMLPTGAAELNLSPLTQTTGIMGIGLVYCSTQHRRMSEIMLSEIEQMDQAWEEEPLRNEGYQLAAGFALGFINLGKGKDLRGLHDMRLAERLLTIASGSKKVSLVHILDKATAAAVVAIALIYMKSENHGVARKVDVPDSVLQFDYIRPDIFLLRTLAKNLIMWSRIEPTQEWLRESLPESYRRRFDLRSVDSLTSDDLPFYNIITGLCFAIALRYAGSASPSVRDLLLHYLDQLMRISNIPSNSYDRKLTRNTVRSCQDLLALATATVMSGTGDILVFRRLRSMHGRDDRETPYGSHLAAHLAIGALFLGGGTFTFNTSDLAIAALLVAFYPIFPSTVQDNESHLQALRHFWVFAAEPRCLVARDISTDHPVSLPVTITSITGEESFRQTPCLLPALDDIATVRTTSTEYWNVVLDFAHNAAHTAAFRRAQTIYVQRRPAHDASTHAFKATLQALSDADALASQPLAWLFELPALRNLTKAERVLVLPSSSEPDGGADAGSAPLQRGLADTVVDTRLVLEHATLSSGQRERLLGLKLVFDWAEQVALEGKELAWLRDEVVQRLRAKVWMLEEE